MKYKVNPAAFSGMFALPADVADKHIKLASEIQLKVLLLVFRNTATEISVSDISRFLLISDEETQDALLFWAQRGILMSEETAAIKENGEKAAVINVVNNEKPSRIDVARRGNEDKKVKLLLSEAQLKFGRALKTNEASTLVWIYDDLGLELSVILLLIQYAVNEGRCNISFIEKTAVKWSNDGIASVSDADRAIAEDAKKRLAWRTVESVFGIEKRNPSDRELELSLLWVDEWKISKEMLKAAYDACVDSKSKLSVPYIAKILENWHKNGYEKPEDVKDAKNKKNDKKKEDKKYGYAAYDLDLFEKMLDDD